ncbi:unnamed protein product [Cuscuta campestris]|uniref:Uncharacterized protein n=1 Tax=Cuscuta campestris TaxID=132261 RepID=A0A484MI37_9ASTE|nr:unnamed protein product [Cuscuta campestris]
MAVSSSYPPATKASITNERCCSALVAVSNQQHSLLDSRDQYQRVGVQCTCLQLWQWYGLHHLFHALLVLELHEEYMFSG